MAATEFKIFTGLLKASRSQDGKLRLHGVASSTTKDLHGDTMLASAIDDMEAAANNNLTIFLNHSYEVPEDVGGSVEKAHSVTRGVDQDGNPNIDLNLDIVMNDANPRAIATWEAIERGTKLGLSIGAFIPDGGAKRNKDGSYVIEHIDLKETSIVGIPANPRSWVEYAVKALKAGGQDRTATVPLGSPTLTVSDTDYTVYGTLDSTNIVWAKALEPVVEPEPEPEPVENSVEPDVTDAQVTIIQIDTDGGESAAEVETPSSSQEAPESSPENGDGLLDETANGDDAALGDDVTRSAPSDLTRTLNDTLRLLRDSTRELVEARKALAVSEESRMSMEIERNAMRLERDHVLRATKQILDRVASSPLVRKAVAVDAQRDFRARFEGVYSEEILNLLERNEP